MVTFWKLRGCWKAWNQVSYITKIELDFTYLDCAWGRGQDQNASRLFRKIWVVKTSMHQCWCEKAFQTPPVWISRQVTTNCVFKIDVWIQTTRFEPLALSRRQSPPVPTGVMPKTNSHKHLQMQLLWKMPLHNFPSLSTVAIQMANPKKRLG